MQWGGPFHSKHENLCGMFVQVPGENPFGEAISRQMITWPLDSDFFAGCLA